MRNLRSTLLLLLLGSAALAGALVLLSGRSRQVATANTRDTLCTFAPEAVDTVEISWRGSTNTISLLREEGGDWWLKAPYSAPADAAAVARLVDVATMAPLGDMRTEAELAELREDFADFGLADGGGVQLRLHAGAREERVGFGARTASGREVYARTMGLRNVFTMSSGVLDAMPQDADAFRRRVVVSCPREEIAGIDLRAPGSPFVKLVRERSGWMVVSQVEGPADFAAVDALADGLVSARVSGFILPSAAHPRTTSGAESPVRPDASAPPEPAPRSEVIKTDALAPYGLGADAGRVVTVRGASGTAEQVVFGSPAGTNLVYALVQNGTAVVTLDAALADLCRTGGDSFLDTRVFPLGEGERLKSISFMVESLVYVLAQGTNGVWRLEAPVVAPVDAAATAAVVDRVLRLRRNDVPDETPAAKDAVRVSVSTTSAALPGVTVPRRVFAECAAFADLRSKVLLELDAAAVRRITVKPKDAAGTAVVRDVGRATWVLDATAGGRPAMVSVERVKKLLVALTRTEAVGVEALAATPDDYRRCGLDVPQFTISVDFDVDAPRKNLLLGGVAPGGGRYATVGGADAVFILSRATVADLTISITE